MAGNRDIHGDVILDVELSGEELAKKRLQESFSKLNAAVNVDVKFPTKKAMQDQLNAKVGDGLKLKVSQLVLPSKKEMQAQIDMIAQKGGGIKLFIDELNLPGKKEMQAQLDSKVGPTGLKLNVHLNITKDSLIPVIAQQQAVQQAITDIEAKQQALRTTISQRESEKRATQDNSALRKKEVNEDIFARRLLDREAALAQRREVIDAQLNARLLAQDNAFNQRRQLAAERAARAQSGSAPGLEGLLAGANRVNSSLADFDRFVSRSLFLSLGAFTAWSAGVVVAFAAVGAAALHTVTEVEQAASRAAGAVASQKIADEINKQGKATSNFGDIAAAAQDRITSSAAKIGLDTLSNTKQVSEGILALVQSGESLNDAIINVASAAKAASVSGEDLGTASTGLAASLASAGLQAKDSAGLLDKFQFVANDTLGNVGDVTDAFANKAASSFRAYGQSVNDTLLVLDLFGKTGIKGQAAGTAASIVIRDLSKAIGKNGDEFAKQGIRVRDSNHKNVTQIQTLSDLSRQFGKTGGDIGATSRLAKAFGFQQKSLQFLLQLFPQVRKEGEKGLGLTEHQIAFGSKGAIDQQFGVIRKQLFFQLDQLKDTFNNALLTIGNSASKQTAHLVDLFAGNDGLVTQIKPELEALGTEIGHVIDDLAAFVQTQAFRNGVKTIGESFRVTIDGVVHAGQELSDAFGTGGAKKSTFEALADSLLGFSRAAAATLPIVAHIIGETLNFIIDHSDAFKTFAKLTIAVYIARKAFTLFLNPIGQVILALGRAQKALAVFAVSEEVGPIKSALGSVAVAMGLVTTQTEAATLATVAFTREQNIAAAAAIRNGVAEQGVSQLGGVLPGFAGRGAFKNINSASKIGNAGREGAATLGEGAALGDAALQARNAAAFEKIAADLATTLPAATGGIVAFASAAAASTGVIVALYGAFEVGIGFVKGFTSELRKASKTDPEFAHSMHVIGDSLHWLNGQLQSSGSAIGKWAADIVVDLTKVNLGKLAKDVLFPDFWSEPAKKAAAAAKKHAAAVEKQREAIRKAVDTTASFNVITGKFTKTTAHASSGFTLFGTTVGSISKTIKGDLSGVASTANSVLTAILRKTAAGQAQLAQAARDSLVLQATVQAGARLDINAQGLIAGGALDPTKIPAVARGLKIIAQQKAAAAKTVAALVSDTGGPPADTGAPAGKAAKIAAPIARKFIDPDNVIKDAIAKLKPAQRIAEVQKSVDDVLKHTNDTYIATRRQTLLLADAVPTLTKNIDKSKQSISSLKDQISALKDVQLEGTKAFTDQLFANDQAQKQLQLNRINLLQTGISAGSQPIVAIDKQLTQLQQDADKINLQQSLQLDPLKKKIDDTLTPTKEMSFADIIAQFTSLTAQQTAQQVQLKDQIDQRDRLNATLKRSSEHYNEIDAAAKRQVDAFNAAQTKAYQHAKALAAVSSSAGAAATQVNKYSTAVENVPSGKGVVDKSLKGINDRVLVLANDFTGAGKNVMLYFTHGLNQESAAVTIPALAKIMGEVNLIITSSNPVAHSAGRSLMDGFLAGMVERSGIGADGSSKFGKGTLAYYLHVVIPEWIKANKGPVSYDATILVPAGQAVMDGFGRGLRDGFGQIQSFVRDVGPSLGEFINGADFNARVAPIFADIMIGKVPDFNAALADLNPGAVPDVGGVLTGPIDPQLSFLHASASLADTTRMANELARLFHMIVTATTNGKHVAGSDHYKGLAADLSNSGGSDQDPHANTPGMERMFRALMPFVGPGNAIGQLIHDGRILGRNAGPITDPAHWAHVHVGFNPAAGFSEFSGKFGKASPFPPLLTGLTQGPAQLFRAAGEPLAIAEVISRAATAVGVNVKLLTALTKAESGFNPRAGSPAGAYGLTQLLRGTAASLGVTNIFDPFQNELGGAKYLKQQLDRFHDVRLALAAYNAGPAAVDKYHGIPPYKETQDYVRRILGFMKSFGGFREMGGPVQAGKAYVVGEKRPEIFVPRQAGTILPDAAATMSRNGVQDNRTINVSVQTAATDPNAVADAFEARMRSRMTGVNFRR